MCGLDGKVPDDKSCLSWICHKTDPFGYIAFYLMTCLVTRLYPKPFSFFEESYSNQKEQEPLAICFIISPSYLIWISQIFSMGPFELLRC